MTAPQKDCWAIGDLHGCSLAFRRLLEKIAPGSNTRLILLGDYGDRGPDTKGVVDEILALRLNGIEVVPLAGNHDLMLVQLLGALRGFYPPGILGTDEYLSFMIEGNGFRQTAVSYGWPVTANILELLAEPAKCKLPDDHLQFFLNLQLAHFEDIGPGYLCVHAGLREHGLRMATAAEAIKWTLENAPNDLVERRGLFTFQPSFPSIIVHGHTPWSVMLENYVPLPDRTLFNVLPGVVRGRINLDSGVASSKGPRLLTAVRFAERVEDLRFEQASQLAC